MVAQNVAFGIIAAVVVLSAIRVVTTGNVVHAALYLVLVLAGVGASYVLLAAEFVAVVQVLVYIGAIVVLFLFGIMLTRAPIGRMPRLVHDHWYAGLFTAVLLAAVLGYVLIDAFEDVEVEPGTVGTTALVSDSIFSTYLIPFEVVSVLLLAALVGAIVLARRD
ncbi:MAG TPA: NADH-quinone oxidoreductase subunit J [Acidimicrobiales bacterium]|jgi:NADH-quinone oxidoreductase subunit J